jgi:hypothetical protein
MSLWPRLLPLIFVAPLSACSTVAETIFESEAPTYYQATDSSGQEVYRRQRIVHESERNTSPAVSFIGFTDSISSSLSGPSESYLNLRQSHPEPDTEEVSSAFTVGMFVQKETWNSDLSYEFVGDVFSWDVGLSMVNSDKTYLGFSTMARLQAPWKLAPYLGVGLYGGDSKTCYYEPLGYGYSEEICEKYFLISLVGELGLQYQFNNRLRTRLAVRHFTNTRQEDPLGKTLYGVNIGVLF